MRSVSYFKLDDGPQQWKGHGGDFSRVLVFIADGQAADDHIGVANGLHFIHIVISDDRVEARVQIVEEIHHLFCLLRHAEVIAYRFDSHLNFNVENILPAADLTVLTFP